MKQENIFFRVSQRLQIGFDAQCLSKTAVEPNQEDVEPEAFILSRQMVKKDSTSGNSTQKSVKEYFKTGYKTTNNVSLHSITTADRTGICKHLLSSCCTESSENIAQ